jgi:DNA-binding beta-propeller fold protein YncE
MAEPFILGHFDLNPTGELVAVVNYTTRSVDVLGASFLTRIRSIFLEEYDLLYVAFDPREEKLYVTGVGRDSKGRFLVLDLISNLVLESISLGPLGSGDSYNPVAVFADGRYVAFDYGGSVVIVDTDLDLPRYRFEPPGGDVILWNSVTALPNSDLLYVLSGPRGTLSKVRIR